MLRRVKVSIQRKARASDGAGGFLEQWTQISLESGRVVSRKSSDVLVNGRRTASYTLVLCLPDNSLAREGDRAVIVSSNSKYEIVSKRLKGVRETYWDVREVQLEF